MRKLIKGGQIIDPGRISGCGDILIDHNRIVGLRLSDPNGQMVEGLAAWPDDETSHPAEMVIDARGWLVVPGLIDMHVHLREPGHEYKETIASGCQAAAAGGFTAVCAMPNTDPVNDNAQVTQFIMQKAAEARGARVYPVAAISRNLAGGGLSDYGELKEAGAIALSDDGYPVIDSQLMRRAMEYAQAFGLLMISHSEEMSLAKGGAMNEGEVATRLGLTGIPNAAESIMVMREIALSELTGAPTHIAHVSTRESVRMIRSAKAWGIPVSAETAPHYFALTDEAVATYDTHAKMNPPLRSEADRQAIREGLADGTLNAIATDHAPHSVLEKEVAFDEAANGIIGLETALPLCLQLVRDGVIDTETMIAKMSTNPARLLGLNRAIEGQALADLTLIDPDVTFTIDASQFLSRSRNTPFDGWSCQGKAMCTLVEGELVYCDRDNTAERITGVDRD